MPFTFSICIIASCFFYLYNLFIPCKMKMQLKAQSHLGQKAIKSESTKEIGEKVIDLDMVSRNGVFWYLFAYNRIIVLLSQLKRMGISSLIEIPKQVTHWRQIEKAKAKQWHLNLKIKMICREARRKQCRVFFLFCVSYVPTVAADPVCFVFFIFLACLFLEFEISFGPLTFKTALLKSLILHSFYFSMLTAVK